MTEPTNLNVNASAELNQVQNVENAQSTSANQELGDVKKPSGWAMFGRVMLAIVTLGISEGIRAIVSHVRNNPPNPPHLQHLDLYKAEDDIAKASENFFTKMVEHCQSKFKLDQFQAENLASNLEFGCRHFLVNAARKDDHNFNLQVRLSEFENVAIKAAKYLTEKHTYDMPVFVYIKSGKANEAELDSIINALNKLDNLVQNETVNTMLAKSYSHLLVGEDGVINQTTMDKINNG